MSSDYAAALAALDALAETVDRGDAPIYVDGIPLSPPPDALRNIAPQLIALARTMVDVRRLQDDYGSEHGEDAWDDAMIARDNATLALIAALTEAGPPAGEDR